MSPHGPVVERINERLAAAWCQQTGERVSSRRASLWGAITDVLRFRVPNLALLRENTGRSGSRYGMLYRDAIDQVLKGESDPEKGALLALMLLQMGLQELRRAGGPRSREAGAVPDEAWRAVQDLWRRRFAAGARKIVGEHDLANRKLGELAQDVVQPREGFEIFTAALRRRHPAVYYEVMKLRVGSVTFRRRRLRDGLRSRPLLDVMVGDLCEVLRFLYPQRVNRRLGDARPATYLWPLMQDIADLVRTEWPAFFGDLTAHDVASALQRFREHHRRIPA